MHFFRITLSLNIYSFALKYTSATFAAATTNTIPAITFVMAVILRYVYILHIYGVSEGIFKFHLKILAKSQSNYFRMYIVYIMLYDLNKR